MKAKVVFSGFGGLINNSSVIIKGKLNWTLTLNLNLKQWDR